MKLLNILLDLYKEEYSINLKEGEIKTVQLNKTVSILHRKYSNILNFKSDNIDNTFKVIFSQKIDLSKFNDLLKDANNLGWFPSFMQSKEYVGKYEKKYAEYYIKDGVTFSIFFEAKFDIIIEKYPKILYHIAPTINSNKIEKIGLVPKSRSKASYHPDRVYLALSKESALYLVDNFTYKTGIKNWTLFSIDTDKIPGDYLKLYEDPNYKSNGCYTLNNIPPSAITRVEDLKS